VHAAGQDVRLHRKQSFRTPARPAHVIGMPMHRINANINLRAQSTAHVGRLHDRAGRALRIAAAATTLLLLVAVPVGCVTVDPRPDFAQASAVIRAHTGTTDVYDPDTEVLIEQRISELLQDGLTVDEAVAVAMLNNPGFQSLFQDIGASRADVVQSGLLSNPTLSLGFRLPEGGGRAEITGALAQQIVDLWQIPVRKRIAESELDRTVTLVAHRATIMAADVRRRYYEVLSALRAENLATEDVQLVRQTLRLAEARLRAGDVGPLDVNLVRVNLLDVQVEETTLKQARVVAELALARALGLSGTTAPLSLASALPQPHLLASDPESLLSSAMAQRLDVRAAVKAVEAAEDELERQCLNVFPSIIVGMTGERTERRSLPSRNILADTARASVAAGQLTAPSIQSRSQRDQARRQHIDALLGATVSITLPIWDQNQANIAKARYDVIRKRKWLEGLIDDAVHDVRAATTQITTARHLVEFFDNEVLVQAEQNVQGASKVYESGEQGILPLIEAQETLIRQRRRYVGILQDYAVSLVDLELAVGGRIPEATDSPSNGGNDDPS